MVRGLERFASHFAGFQDQFVLIGGTAVVAALEDAGLPARATKDLDIVLCVEVLNPDFVAAFRKFVEIGGYKTREVSGEKREFYRFMKPTDDSFPYMLELFSRKPDMLKLGPDQRITPIPAGGEAESLSAILLDDDYYAFLHQQKTAMASVPMVTSIGLIALKAYAWLVLSEQRRQGAPIDEKNISKHRNDVFRLYQLITPDMRVSAPERVRRDVARFLGALEPSTDLKPFGLGTATVSELSHVLRQVFQLV